MNEISYKDNHSDTFDTALAFLECRAREAGLKDFSLDKAFTYNETQQNELDDGFVSETVLFDHVSGKRTFGLEVFKDEVTSVWVSDDNGDFVDEGTDVSNIRNDPKSWFDKVLP